MDLKRLSDKELEASFHRVVRTERKIMHIVILHVQEVALRKLYLGRSIPTLRNYLIEVMNYSSTAAQSRIEAANLLTEVPSIAEKLQAGKLNLAQIGEIHRAIQRAEKIHDEEISSTYKARIVHEVSGMTSSQTQQVCAEMLAIPVIEGQKVTTQKDGSKRYSYTVSKEQDEKLERVRGILAQKNFQKKRSQMMPDILETICDEIIEAYERVSLKKRPQKISETELLCDGTRKGSETEARRNSETETALLKTKWKTLTPKRKKILLKLENCCQYEDYETGRVCGSQFQLEIDHIIPRHAGGTNDPGNLRVLCRAHNQYRNH